MAGLLSLDEPPTAVFAASDMMALGAIRAAGDAGLNVPADVSVIGFDDIQLADHMNPPLTTVRQDKARPRCRRGHGARAPDRWRAG